MPPDLSRMGEYDVGLLERCRDAHPACPLAQAMPVMPMQAVSIVTTDTVREVGGGPTSSIADEINKLADLQAKGLLTAEQFETAKNKVIQSI